MNPETPPSPREELEIRLTALLMGELLPEETAALETQLAADPELAALHVRLRQAMELLREASALPEHPAPPEPVQLSAKKREHLLAHFKAPAPALSSVIVKLRGNWRQYVPLGLAAALVAFLGWSLMLIKQVSAIRAASGIADPRALTGMPGLVERALIWAEGDSQNSLAESRWDSQPGSLRGFQHGNSAGGVSGADANGNHWAFQQPPSANAPTNGRTTFWREEGSTRLDVKLSSAEGLEPAPARESGLAREEKSAPATVFESLPAEQRVAGRTAFWSDDAANKLNVNSASEATFWEKPATDSTSALVAKSDPASDATGPSAEKQIAANSVVFAAPRGGVSEEMRRSARFAVLPPAPPTAAAPAPLASVLASGAANPAVESKLTSDAKMQVTTGQAEPASESAPQPVTRGTVNASKAASVTSLFAGVPHVDALAANAAVDRGVRLGERGEIAARTPIKLTPNVTGVTPVPAGASEFDQGISKHMDGRFRGKADEATATFSKETNAPANADHFGRALSRAGDKVSVENSVGESQTNFAINGRALASGSIALPKLEAAAGAAPADAKEALFFDFDIDGFAKLNGLTDAPTSGPAPAAPTLPETLSKSQFAGFGFGGGKAAMDGEEGRTSGSNRAAAERDFFYKETTGTFAGRATQAGAAPATEFDAVTDGTTALGLMRGTLAQVEKGKAATDEFLSYQTQFGNEAGLGDLQGKVATAESEGRVMQERSADFGTISGGAGGVAAGNTSRSRDWSGQVTPNALVWFGDGVASGKDAPAARPQLEAEAKPRSIEDNVELALGEKPAGPANASGVEAPVPRSLSFGASQPQKAEYQRAPNLGTEGRAKSKATPPAKPGAVAKNGAKMEREQVKEIEELAMLAEPELKQNLKELSDTEAVAGKPVEVAKREEAVTKRLYESVDELAMQVEPELKAEVEALVSKHTGAINQARNVTRSATDVLMDGYRKEVDAVKELQAEIDKPSLGKDVREQKSRARDEKLALLDVKQRAIDAARLEREAAMKKDSEADREKLLGLMERNKALVAAKMQKDSDDKPAAPKPAEPAPEPQAEVATSANAFSTFSLNVSDVAFKLAAASLEKGQMPELATVRSEEFINAFDYHDPEPAGGAPLAFASERARYLFAQNRDLLRLSVKTAAAGRQPGRALNLVLLLDNSGSMERADRVCILHESLRVLAAQLQPQDKLSVVTFARTPRLWADGVAGDKAGEVTARVGEITPQGGTNLSAALDLGYATARKHFQPGSINRVVLLTDGAANLGDVNPDALKQKVETNRKLGVALDCFGIGWEGYDDTLLEALSRNGDGRYGFINSPEEAATEFAAQLAGALRVAASDVKVQVEFNPRRVTAYRQIGYAKHQLKKEQFRDNTVDAAEIGAAESGNALYAVEVNPRGEGDLATVRVRFKVPGTSDYREHEWTVPFTREAAPLEQASPALRLAGTASAFSEWLTSSQYATEVTPDRLLGLLNGVPQTFGADPRPQKLEWMIRTAKSVSGK